MYNAYTMECYSAIKKNEILPLAMLTDLEIIILSEIDKYTISHRWNLKVINRNLFTKQTLIDVKNSYGRGKERRDKLV